MVVCMIAWHEMNKLHLTVNKTTRKSSHHSGTFFMFFFDTIFEFRHQNLADCISMYNVHEMKL